jgi:aminobenzoyl-glutamate utilization protein B
MATPIAHKGTVAGAKALALTVLDLMTSPDELIRAKAFFDNDQQKYDHYKPLLTAGDAPAIHVNDDYMRTYRPLMEPYYYDAGKYPSYLDQLGIKYPSPPTGPLRKITPPKSFNSDTGTGG